MPPKHLTESKTDEVDEKQRDALDPAVTDFSDIPTRSERESDLTRHKMLRALSPDLTSVSKRKNFSDPTTALLKRGPSNKEEKSRNLLDKASHSRQRRRISPVKNAKNVSKSAKFTDFLAVDDSQRIVTQRVAADKEPKKVIKDNLKLIKAIDDANERNKQAKLVRDISAEKSQSHSLKGEEKYFPNQEPKPVTKESLKLLKAVEDANEESTKVKPAGTTSTENDSKRSSLKKVKFEENRTSSLVLEGIHNVLHTFTGEHEPNSSVKGSINSLKTVDGSIKKVTENDQKGSIKLEEKNQKDRKHPSFKEKHTSILHTFTGEHEPNSSVKSSINLLRTVNGSIKKVTENDQKGSIKLEEKNQKNRKHPSFEEKHTSNEFQKLAEEYEPVAEIENDDAEEPDPTKPKKDINKKLLKKVSDNIKPKDSIPERDSKQSSKNTKFVEDPTPIIENPETPTLSKENDADEEAIDSPLTPRRRLSNPFMSKGKFTMKNDAFNKSILNIAKMNRLKSKVASKRIQLSEREINTNIIKKVNFLRYRENVFRAASKLSADHPPFPRWSYKDLPDDQLDIITFNVGGMRFETFDETIMNFPNTKLADCFIDHTSGPTIFFDRNPVCFGSVLNFYRTGRLHAPSNTCLSFFENELEFWGINEDLMEPCCYGDYKASKIASNNLKIYMDDRDKILGGKTERFSFQQKVYNISIMEDKGLLGMWYQSICSLAILISIFIMIISTWEMGRVSIASDSYAKKKENETTEDYFKRTKNNHIVQVLEVFVVGFFGADFIYRVSFCPNRIIFCADLINWLEMFATLSSFIALLTSSLANNYEVLGILLKLPRIFRLFRVTNNLRCGIDALSMTLASSTNELKLVFIITLISTVIFGSLIFIVETASTEVGATSTFSSVFDGMWWAIVTMSTVGYGDYVPKSTGGYFIGYLCILVGIIITQLPVPIFLKNFSLYYNQIHARLEQTDNKYTGRIDPETFAAQSKIEGKGLSESISNELNNMKTMKTSKLSNPI